MDTPISRRSFLNQLAVAGGVLGIGNVSHGCGGSDEATTPNPEAAASSQSSTRPLRLLILGGTGFIGPHQVRYALSRGHQLTLFNRGRSEPNLYAELYDDVEKLVGDRNDDLRSLEGREWDVALDNSGYRPEQVRASAGLLKDAVGRYLFVSTQSVYTSRAIVNQDESGAVGMTGVPEEEWKGYGPLKALCEKEGRAAFGDRFTVVRPTVIVGPGDRTDRFTYWLMRMDRGSDMLAPGTPDDPVQWIDVRALTEFMIHLLEQDQGGVYNATGPVEPITFASLLEAMREVTGSDASLTWVDGDFMRERGIRPFSDLPMWMPPKGDTAAFMRMSAAAAIAAGLIHRPLSLTLSDLLAWCRDQPPERWTDMRAGLSPEQEHELLAAWRARA